MLILILGENGSGKSAYAEKLVEHLGGPKYYIATMIPYGTEGAKRVKKHLAQRKDCGFVTLELPYVAKDAEVSPDSTVLLEDVSNLLANGMFERGYIWQDVKTDIIALRARCRILVAVTIQGLLAEKYQGETQTYIDALRLLNNALFQEADLVVQMQHKAPEIIKGETDGIL